MKRMSYAQEYMEMMALLQARDTQPVRKKHRLAAEQYAISGCEYFFTICARHLGCPFLDPVLAQAIIDSLLWRKDKHHWRLFCYCLMPDHLHFIVQLLEADLHWINAGARGTVPEGVLEQVGHFKSYTTTQLWWPAGHRGPLWQQSSYDKVMDYTDSIADAVNYVLNNAVRKQLAETWEEYPYAAIVDEW